MTVTVIVSVLIGALLIGSSIYVINKGYSRKWDDEA
jgi:hypothetical protein